MFRLLVLALLPLIAVLLYYEGQSYDPALIDFTSREKTLDRGAAFFPVEIGGYSKAGQITTYGKDNLYEYVNGHAEYFLSAGFERLWVSEYVRTGSEPDQPDVIVDIYDMGRAIQAFGVLVDEAGDGGAEGGVGMMSFRTAQGFNFIAGKYFVKMSAYDDAVPMVLFAERIEKEIAAEAESFAAFSRFPDLGEVAATRFVREAYRGLGFLRNVIEREYLVGGDTFQVFLVLGQEQEIQELTASFQDFFRRTGVEYVSIERAGKTVYKVMDPYEGEWFLIPAGDALFGLFGSGDDALLDRFHGS